MDRAIQRCLFPMKSNCHLTKELDDRRGYAHQILPKHQDGQDNR